MARVTRVNAGRGHWYRGVDGHKIDGVTTVLSDGMPKPALTSWAARETAEFAVDHLPTIQGLDRDAAVDLLKGAPWRDRDRAARRGTEVHGLAQRIVAGEEVEVPDELAGHVESYLAFLADWEPTDEITEAVVLHATYGYAGTLDMIATIPALGERCLLDVKTSRSGPFPEVALQLAAYRWAEVYVDAAGEEQPMPEIDWTGVVWVRADGYDLIPFETGERVIRAFRYCQQVARFARRDGWGDETKGPVLRPEGVEVA